MPTNTEAPEQICQCSHVYGLHSMRISGSTQCCICRCSEFKESIDANSEPEEVLSETRAKARSIIVNWSDLTDLEERIVQAISNAHAAPVPLAEDRVEAEKLMRAQFPNDWMDQPNLTNAIIALLTRVRAEQREGDTAKLDAIAADYDKDLMMNGEFASAKHEAVEYAAEVIRQGKP